MFYRFRRILCTCLAMLMLCALIPASAEGFPTKTRVYISSNILTAHKSPDENSKVLGVMTYGESMIMLSFGGDWVRIMNAKGQIGYCKLAGLSTVNPNTLNEAVYAKANGTPVYHKASASYKKLAYVKQNAKLHAVAMTADGKWIRVKNGSIYGYVSTDDVSRDPVTVHGALVAKPVYVVSEQASTVYSGKGGGRSMGNISHGQNYSLLYTDGRYSYVRNSKGQKGWCLTELLSTENPNNMNQTMYAQVSGYMLYGNSIVKGNGKYIKKDTPVTVVAQTPEGGWYRVKYGGKFYYVQSILLSDEKAPADGREVYALSEEYLYAKPNFSAAKTGKVGANENLHLIGMSKHGARVRTADGKTGYLPIGMLDPVAWTFSVAWT